MSLEKAVKKFQRREKNKMAKKEHHKEMSCKGAKPAKGMKHEEHKEHKKEHLHKEKKHHKKK